MVSGKTRLFALLGRPVAHSLSPAMQNAAFQALGLDAVYAAIDCAPEDVAPLARTLAAAGGGGNATVPHKGTLAGALTRSVARISGLGTANTFWGEDGALVGDSTDVAGVIDALTAIEAPRQGTWLILGTGGSARAVVGAAIQCSAEVVCVSRSEARGREFREWATGVGASIGFTVDADVVINTTPLGMEGVPGLPADLAETPRAQWALDLVYRRGETEWVRYCRSKGLRASDGREMLVAQGAASLERWFPKVRAPREVMRAAVARALA